MTQAPTKTANAMASPYDPNATQKTNTLATGDLHDYIQAAWSFAISILWPDKDFSDSDIVKALSEIQSFFSTARDLGTALQTFFARVMVGKANEKKCPILHPGIWLNPINIDGLTSPATKANKMLAMQRKVPQFNSIVQILSGHYFQYIKNNQVAEIMACKDELDEIGAGSWMGTFYDGLQKQPTV